MLVTAQGYSSANNEDIIKHTCYGLNYKRFGSRWALGCPSKPIWRVNVFLGWLHCSGIRSPSHIPVCLTACYYFLLRWLSVNISTCGAIYKKQLHWIPANNKNFRRHTHQRASARAVVMRAGMGHALYAWALVTDWSFLIESNCWPQAQS